MKRDSSDDPQDDKARGGVEESSPDPSVGDLIFVLLLPAVAIASPWVVSGLTTTWWIWLIAVGLIEPALLLVGLRQLNNFTTRKLKDAHAKGRQRWPVPSVSPSEKDEFQAQIDSYLTNSQLTPDQLDLFAVALTYPAQVRRRCTDRYVIGSRTLQRKTSLEFDVDPTLVRWYLNQVNDGSQAPKNGRIDSAGGDSQSAAGVQERSKFVPVLLLPKGVLHDYSRFVDAAGNDVSALSYKEYRILAGLTMRRLLIAAYKSADFVPERAWELESHYFQLLIQFGVIRHGDDSTASRVNEVVSGLRKLRSSKPPDGVPVLDDAGKVYIRVLINLVRMVATNYAVVAVLPADSPNRFFLTYESVEIPTIRHPTASWRGRLRHFIGATPLTFWLGAANATTCQSYHLLVDGPAKSYLADMETPFIEQREDGQLPTDSKSPYHRVRGRRGQGYFHLYSRVGAKIKRDQIERFHVGLRFHEIPFGSIGSAALSAMVAFASCFIVALATSGDIDAIDANLAVFLLASPGLAAVWLGLDAGHERLGEAQSWTIASLATTFMAALAATMLLFSQKAGLAPSGSVISAYAPSAMWFPILAVAAVNASIAGGVLWQRWKYYNTLRRRPAATTSFVYYA